MITAVYTRATEIRILFALGTVCTSRFYCKPGRFIHPNWVVTFIVNDIATPIILLLGIEL